jgi:hypothetical protein
MAWTAPRTWVTAEVITATIMNVHVSDNLIALDQHTHDGSSGDGNDELTGLDHITYDDASAPAAPGSSKLRLYSVSGILRNRAGSAGADHKVAPANTGTYTGDGATSKAITGVGFTPVWVLIARVDGTGEVWHKMAGHSGLTAQRLDASASGTSAITSLDSNGFTVDDNASDADPNTNGVSYAYLALQ